MIPKQGIWKSLYCPGKILSPQRFKSGKIKAIEYDITNCRNDAKVRIFSINVYFLLYLVSLSSNLLLKPCLVLEKQFVYRGL